MWQQLFDSLITEAFMIVAVAEESRGAEHARPWIEQAGAKYWCLIDTEHRVADLYGMVNVPQAVWIDEGGRIVRPAEPAGAYEGFRKMNRTTREMPEDVARLTAHAKTTYLDAIRDWVRHGPKSAYALTAAQAREHLPAPRADVARAQALFRLGQVLVRRGEREEGERWIREASRLHPESWCIWRQGAGVNETGLAALPDFWQRVDALGDDRYYARIDMPGMP